MKDGSRGRSREDLTVKEAQPPSPPHPFVPRGTPEVAKMGKICF